MSFSLWASIMMQVRLSYHCSLLLLFPFLLPYDVTAIVHDNSFSPDAILRITAQNISLGGIQRLTTLVNGSIPGPELRVPENEIAWIRVYNDMKDQNLTMVSRVIRQMVPFLSLMLFDLIEKLFSIGMDSQWLPIRFPTEHHSPVNGPYLPNISSTMNSKCPMDRQERTFITPT